MEERRGMVEGSGDDAEQQQHEERLGGSSSDEEDVEVTADEVAALDG